MFQAIEIDDFRTYRHLSLTLGGGLNVFYGANATGKTNLLEAVAFLATGRSPRTFRDAETVLFGQSSFRLWGAGQRSQRSFTVEVTLDLAKGKSVSVNGRILGRLSSLSRVFPLVYFSPDEVHLINGPPGRRRVFLDQLLCQIEPAYAHYLERFRHVLEQRNALLKEVKIGRSSKDLIPIWDAQFSSYGGEVIARRGAAVLALKEALREEYAHLSPEEAPEIGYRPSLPAGVPTLLTKEDASALLAETLVANRTVEVLRGFTLAGPHLDDLAIALDGREARAYASQGQRRSLLLALKLAAARLIERATGQKPVLLLDDILSELDETHRKRLVTLFAGGSQTLLTCTDPGELQEITPERGNLFLVRKGEVLPGGKGAWGAAG